jgi:hypothetical protein
MARFTSPDANGLPGPTGPTGPAGADGLPGADGVGMPTGGDAGQILVKDTSADYDFTWIDNYANWTSQLKHEVKLGQSISKGQAVYVTSADGTNMIVSKASNATEATSSKTLGLLESGGSTNAKVKVITEGLLSGLNTDSANEGDPVWLGTDGNLIYGLANKPVAPAHLVFIGIVTRKNQNNGEIFIKPQNGFELNELHTVALESNGSIADNEVLAYDTASGLWKNQTASEAGLAQSGAFNYAQTIGTKVTDVNAGGVTIISTSITTNGYPVHVIVTGDADPITSGGWLRLQLYRGSTAIGNVIQCESSAAGENTPYALQIIDTPAAGTYTYYLKTTTVAGSAFNFGEVDGPVMCIMELGK